MSVSLENSDFAYGQKMTGQQNERLPASIAGLMFHFLRQFWGRAIMLPLMSCCSRAIYVSIAYATKLIVDTLLAFHGTDPTTVISALRGPCFLFAALVIGRLGIDSAVWAFSYNIRFPMLARMRSELFAYVQRHSANYFDSNLSGKIAHKTMLVPEQLSLVFERFAFDFISATGFFLVISAYFYVQNHVFAWGVLGYVAVYFSTCIFMGSHIAKYAGAYNAARTMVTGRVADTIANIKNVIFFSAHTYEDKNVDDFVAEERKRRQELYIAVVRLRVVQQLLDMSVWLALFGGAVYAWIHGIITTGGFVMITTMTGMMVRTAYDIGQLFPEFFENIGSLKDGIETLFIPHGMPDITDARPLQMTHGEIQFQNVCFGYENSNPIFKDLNLTILAGQRVGLIGASGAGKTTLTAILLRLHNVQKGAVLIDGQNIAAVTQETLRLGIGLIPQDTILFHRSLIDNIRYGRHNATEEEVIVAAKQAHAHEFIKALPNQYETLVGERGVKLSGGQRQRIAVARALLKNAPILLLDEATSALDSESEAVIQQAMEKAMQNKTVIAIAHRLSTIMHLDRLIVLENGEIQEDGTHSELMEKGGIYARLWSRQSGGFLQENPVGPAVGTMLGEGEEYLALAPYEQQPVLKEQSGEQ